MVKEWKYLKSIILLTVIYGIGNLNFFGISFAFDTEGIGYGYNSMIAGCVEMVSFVYLSKIFIKERSHYQRFTKKKRNHGILLYSSYFRIILFNS